MRLFREIISAWSPGSRKNLFWWMWRQWRPFHFQHGDTAPIPIYRLQIAAHCNFDLLFIFSVTSRGFAGIINTHVLSTHNQGGVVAGPTVEHSAAHRTKCPIRRWNGKSASLRLTLMSLCRGWWCSDVILIVFCLWDSSFRSEWSRLKRSDFY